MISSVDVIDAKHMGRGVVNNVEYEHLAFRHCGKAESRLTRRKIATSVCQSVPSKGNALIRIQVEKLFESLRLSFAWAGRRNSARSGSSASSREAGAAPCARKDGISQSADKATEKLRNCAGERNTRRKVIQTNSSKQTPGGRAGTSGIDIGPPTQPSRASITLTVRSASITLYQGFGRVGT